MKAIISLSGGMDSAVVLAEALAAERQVEAVGFFYGSHHNSYENKAAEAVAKHYGVPFRLIDLSGVMAGFKSNLLDGEVPEGHYEDASMSKTVVPGRNIIFASILAGLAWSREAGEVWLGIHSGDHAIYPDCRPGFFWAMKRAVEEGADGRVTLVAPFLMNSKGHIVRRGLELGVPFGLTRTCYKPQQKPCGKCGSCTERLEAFASNGVEDPVEYGK
ncbi:MAG: 7-cyano-7-deazaguanine synthase QueC [Bacilli bacterium]|jgi:7-cyano-7-deazaguanine synthase